MYIIYVIYSLYVGKISVKFKISLNKILNNIYFYVSVECERPINKNNALFVKISFTCWKVHSWSSNIKQILLGWRLTYCLNISATVLFFFSWPCTDHSILIYPRSPLKKNKRCSRRTTFIIKIVVMIKKIYSKKKHAIYILFKNDS